MADPTPYIVSYSFSGFQANNPTTPLPAPALDNELADVAASVATLIAAIKDVRRSDGKLQNNSVDFPQLSQSLQLTFDPTNGALVAAAVAGAASSAIAASNSQTAALTFSNASAASAAAAAASAATVNLALYLPKAGNLAGMGSPDTARGNILAAKVDGSDMVGRIAPAAVATVTDWNTVTTSGWYAGNNAANGPTVDFWLVQTIAYGTRFITQIGYNVGAASTGVDAVIPYRRHSYDTGIGIAWQPWQTMGPVPVGTTIWVNAVTAPPGFLKENGALLSRAVFPGLFAYALASGNIVSDASWSSGNSGAFSTGDLSTTFRIPDSRGEFIRGYDDSRGIDAGRVIGLHQTDSLKDHTHSYLAGSNGVTYAPNAGSSAGFAATAQSTGSPSTGAAAETRPRNNAKLACIKY